MQPVLNERKHKVLINAVEDYIKDASPITSGTIHERHIKDISTATLRNELNALEAMGFLKQLHTSGGRVPTTLGYRYYVNSILKDIKLEKNALESVKELLDSRSNSLTEIVSELAKIISKAVNYPTVIIANGYDQLVINSIKVFPLVDGQALTLIQTESGYITNTIKTTASIKSCEDASKYLSRIYTGKTIKEMLETIELTENKMLDEISSFKIIVDNLIDGMKKVLEKQKLSIGTNGSSQFIESFSSSPDQTQKVLKLLDNEIELEKAMKLEDKQDLTITLVEEETFSGCALVKAPIVINGKAVASIGVVGPQRMNYPLIASALKVVMNEMQNNSSKGEDNE